LSSIENTGIPERITDKVGNNRFVLTKNRKSEEEM
jgi:hypothetical protein